jgi:hypothetical protein
MATKVTSDREQRLRELRGGAEGVRSWNARVAKEEAAGDFRGVDLSGADLAGVNLGSLDFQGARFDGATLTGAWLRECDLGGASFKGANLEQSWCAGARFAEADFERASLARCNLRGCDFRKARFGSADLRGATLDGADLCGADLGSANVNDATFAQARYDEQTRWPRGFEPPAGLTWVGTGTPPLDFDIFLRRLGTLVDRGRLGRALEMLKAERFYLFSHVESRALVGVVRSQTDPGLVYSCRLTAEGAFACCTQDLALCLGLRTAVCKHLLVLLVGLVKAEEVDPRTVLDWVRASQTRRPTLDEDLLAETLLRYKAAQAGAIDWRPIETIPEDYYAL